MSLWFLFLSKKTHKKSYRTIISSASFIFLNIFSWHGFRYFMVVMKMYYSVGNLQMCVSNLKQTVMEHSIATVLTGYGKGTLLGLGRVKLNSLTCVNGSSFLAGDLFASTFSFSSDTNSFNSGNHLGKKQIHALYYILLTSETKNICYSWIWLVLWVTLC